jgi:hypothetical protein
MGNTALNTKVNPRSHYHNIIWTGGDAGRRCEQQYRKIKLHRCVVPFWEDSDIYCLIFYHPKPGFNIFCLTFFQFLLIVRAKESKYFKFRGNKEGYTYVPPKISADQLKTLRHYKSRPSNLLLRLNRLRAKHTCCMNLLAKLCSLTNKNLLKQLLLFGGTDGWLKSR